MFEKIKHVFERVVLGRIQSSQELQWEQKRGLEYDALFNFFDQREWAEGHRLKYFIEDYKRGSRVTPLNNVKKLHIVDDNDGRFSVTAERDDYQDNLTIASSLTLKEADSVLRDFNEFVLKASETKASALKLTVSP